MKRVMVQQEKQMFEKRIQDEQMDYFRKKKVRDEVD